MSSGLLTTYYLLRISYYLLLTTYYLLLLGPPAKEEVVVTSGLGFGSRSQSADLAEQEREGDGGDYGKDAKDNETQGLSFEL